MRPGRAMVPADAGDIQFTATCAGCGAVIPADQVMCATCASR